jgi:pimeloyl-ACP methyl ester carboxylesterase
MGKAIRVAEHSITLDGRQLAFRSSRGDGPAVLLLHGNSSSARTWHRLLDGPFGDRHRCIAPDLPGHGRSYRASRYSLASYATVVSRFVEAVVDGPVIVVGWSLGGHIALEAASTIHDLQGLALFGAPPIASPADVPHAFRPDPAATLAFTADLSDQDAIRFAELLVAPGSPVPLEPLVADIHTTDPAVRADVGACLGGGEFADEIRVVESLGRPIMIGHGRQDRLVAEDYLRGLRIPGLWRDEVQIIENCGHSPQEEQATQLGELLEWFAADIRSYGPRHLRA